MTTIDDYYSGKSILITGGTGLIGRVLVEKLLRDLPQVAQLYILIRPKQRGERTISAKERLWQELFASSAFDRLHHEQGLRFQALLEEKVTPVSGDLSLPDLGLDQESYKQLQQEIDLIINCAAVVSFDAPLDTALELNTRGPLRILEFARGCKSATLAHVSTCYVNGTREGPIAEEALDPETLSRTTNQPSAQPFDVDLELESMARLVSRLKPGQGATGIGDEPEMERVARERSERRLVEAGMRWAHKRGFNDTYTLTKAMAEQLLVKHHGDVPLIILRPSIVESALAEPAPGWLDGMRMLDPLIVAYSRHMLPDFPGRADAILDVIPVDLVVNGLLAIVPKARVHEGTAVFHLASGMENPMTLGQFAQLTSERIRRDSVHRDQDRLFPAMTFPTTRSFLRKLRLRYKLPLQALWPVMLGSYMLPQGRRFRTTYRYKRSGLEKLMYYSRIYGPYAEARCQYLTHRTRQLWESLSPEEQIKFNMDVAAIDWRHYIQDVHIPGLRRYVLGMGPRSQGERATPPVQAVAEEVPATNIEVAPAPIVALSAPDDGPAPALSPTRPQTTAVSVTLPPSASAPGLDINHVNGQTTAIGVREAAEKAKTNGVKGNYTNGNGATKLGSTTIKWTRHIPLPSDEELDQWIRSGQRWTPARFLVRWGFDQFFHLYTGVQYEGLENLPQSGPFIVASNHCSHFDTGVLMVLLAKEGNTHPLAAKDYFFRNPASSWLFRSLVDAAPFDRHNPTAQNLGLALGLLKRNHRLLFFPEGGRSADGKMHPFKRGIGLLALESGAPVVPAHISGSFESLPKGRCMPRRHPIVVRFGAPITADSYIERFQGEGPMELSRKLTEDIETAVRDLV